MWTCPGPSRYSRHEHYTFVWSSKWFTWSYTRSRETHKRLDGSNLSTCLVVPFITQLNVHKRLTSVKPIKVLLTLWARRLRFLEPRYSVIFSKWGTQGGRERDRFHFFSFEKNHSFEKGYQRISSFFFFIFLYYTFRDCTREANRMNDTTTRGIFLILFAFKWKKPCMAWRAIEFYLSKDDSRVILGCRVTLCMMIVSLAGKWLFVTIIRMETVENDFDIPRRCYLTLPLGDECITQSIRLVPWYRYPLLPPFSPLFHD